MSNSQTIQEEVGQVSKVLGDQKLEVVVLPVADADRAKRFYENLGWRLDADFAAGDVWRIVQMTPPGSSCSVMFGKGFTTAVPGSVQGTFLVVDDLAAVRAQLLARGVEVTEAFHFPGDRLVIDAQGRAAGRDPQDRSYFSFASFNDPDGNGWLIQEVTTRFSGRGFSVDVATMTELLQEAENRHGEFERISPKHHWSGWYAAYIAGRLQGRTPEAAAADGARQIEQLRGGGQLQDREPAAHS